MIKLQRKIRSKDASQEPRRGGSARHDSPDRDQWLRRWRQHVVGVGEVHHGPRARPAATPNSSRSPTQFTKETGTRVTFVELPYDGLYNRLNSELSSGTVSFDVAAMDAVWLPAFKDGVAPLDEPLHR